MPRRIGGASYELTETRRVKFYEKNYYDHPAFGVIALVTPAPAAARPGADPGSAVQRPTAALDPAWAIQLRLSAGGLHAALERLAALLPGHRASRPAGHPTLAAQAHQTQRRRGIRAALQAIEQRQDARALIADRQDVATGIEGALRTRDDVARRRRPCIDMSSAKTTPWKRSSSRSTPRTQRREALAGT